MICPMCGVGKFVKKVGNSPNGGILFVAEDMGDECACYDTDIVQFKCEPCNVSFYINPEIK